MDCGKTGVVIPRTVTFDAKLDRKFLDKLVQKLIEIIKESEDSIRVYPLCAACETGISVLSQGKLMKEEDVYIL